MPVHLVSKDRNRQPQRPVGINPEFPMPAEVFLPHLTRNGLLRNSIATGGACSISPTAEGLGASFSTTAQYTLPIWDGESKVAWFVLAYRDGSATTTCSLLRKDGTLTPIQEANATVRCVPWPDRTDPLYTINMSDCQNRVNAFGGRIDGANNVLHFNGKRVTFSESVPLSSGANNLCIGGSESNGEIASPWKILAVVLWQKNIPSERQLFSLQKSPWSVFSPETIPLFFSTVTPSGLVIKTWDGSSWVVGNLKRWNGSAWEAATLKYWNGSVWA